MELIQGYIETLKKMIHTFSFKSPYPVLLNQNTTITLTTGTPMSHIHSVIVNDETPVIGALAHGRDKTSVNIALPPDMKQITVTKVEIKWS